tara:strand:- start:3196 stop:3444 length:249 start_codon:yes stop_codon:yes gene_type:complete
MYPPHLALDTRSVVHPAAHAFSIPFQHRDDLHDVSIELVDRQIQRRPDARQISSDVRRILDPVPSGLGQFPSLFSAASSSTI